MWMMYQTLLSAENAYRGSNSATPRALLLLGPSKSPALGKPGRTRPHYQLLLLSWCWAPREGPQSSCSEVSHQVGSLRIFKTWRPKDESVGFSGWNPHACWRVNDPRSENTGTIFRDTVEKPPGKVLNQALWPLKAPGTSRVGGNDNLPGSNWSKSPCWCPPESELLQWSAISATNSLGGFQDSL